ncbi:hypothetical protein DL240_03645 [Lujinxingia litoralis]|uniref:Porin domain-containing protein n=2 Tax=Lujinxingia litoralis TaxID=2211119 RepID=A0A328CC95_9DELT|nr:hypothetical protein DL240_03645 [Lujinxingia litoralis]
MFTLAAAGSLTVAMVPEADAARRASLGQNRLILDKNDVYLFPQAATEYNNLLSLEYGAAPNAGSGLVLLGNESFAYGLGIYRGDLLSPGTYPYNLGHPNLGNVANPLPGLVDQPHTILDFFVGADMGGGSAGARLSFGNGATRQVDAEDVVDSTSHTFVGLTLGYSMLGDTRVDTGLNIQFNSGNQINGGDDVLDTNRLFVGATARAYLPMAERTELGVLGDINFESRGATTRSYDANGVETGSNEGGTTAFGLVAGAGPVYHIKENTTLAGYGLLGFSTSSTDLDKDTDFDGTGMTNLLLPGLHVAADIQLLDWLYFRTGAQYSYSVTIASSEEDPNAGNNVSDSSSMSGRASNFGWRAGLGVELGNFTLDGAFQSGFIVNGPDFLGGAGGGMFTSVAAGYSF